MLKPLGILGGTFDPIHFGHLRMALEIYETFQLEKVLFIPCASPVHKENPMTSPMDRLHMVELATQDVHAFQVDAREIMRQTPSYAIDTLISLRKEMPNRSFAFFLGMDAFMQLPRWHRYTEILNYTHIIVANRPHCILPSTGEIARLLDQHSQDDFSYLQHHTHGGIFFKHTTLLDIGATQIRDKIACGQSIRYLLPDTVVEYIQAKQFYLKSIKSE